MGSDTETDGLGGTCGQQFAPSRSKRDLMPVCVSAISAAAALLVGCGSVAGGGSAKSIEPVRVEYIVVAYGAKALSIVDGRRFEGNSLENATNAGNFALSKGPAEIVMRFCEGTEGVDSRYAGAVSYLVYRYKGKMSTKPIPKGEGPCLHIAPDRSGAPVVFYVIDEHTFLVDGRRHESLKSAVSDVVAKRPVRVEFPSCRSTISYRFNVIALLAEAKYSGPFSLRPTAKEDCLEDSLLAYPQGPAQQSGN